MDTLRYDDGWFSIFYRVIIMDNGLMEKLKDKLTKFEDDIFSGKDIDVKEFYKLKKHLLDTKKR